MIVGAETFRHRVVRGVSNEDVGEAKTIFAGERAHVRADQPLAHEGLERAGDFRLLLERGQVGDGAPPEHLADHSRALKHGPLER